MRVSERMRGRSGAAPLLVTFMIAARRLEARTPDHAHGHCSARLEATKVGGARHAQKLGGFLKPRLLRSRECGVALHAQWMVFLFRDVSGIEVLRKPTETYHQVCQWCDKHIETASQNNGGNTFVHLFAASVGGR